MKRLLLAIPLLVFISPVNAFWGLSEEEKSICRDRASRERNEFLSKAHALLKFYRFPSLVKIFVHNSHQQKTKLEIFYKNLF